MPRHAWNHGAARGFDDRLGAYSSVPSPGCVREPATHSERGPGAATTRAKPDHAARRLGVEHVAFHEGAQA